MSKKYFLVPALLLLVLLTVTACGGGGGGTSGAAERAAQVTAGQVVYREQCATCHGQNYEGVSAPALDKPTLAEYKDGKTLFDFISKNMPLTNPGGLTQDQYLQVTALLLDHVQALPADQKLTTDNAANIKLTP